MLDQIVVCIANTVIFFIVCFLLGVTIIGLLAIPAVLGGYTESLIRAARGDKLGIGDFSKWVSISLEHCWEAEFYLYWELELG